MGLRPGAPAIARSLVIDVRAAPATGFNGGIEKPKNIFFILKQNTVSDGFVRKPGFAGALSR